MNQVNRLVSSSKEIIAALHQEYMERLIIRKIRPDFKDQKKLDKELVRLKINKARLNKSKPFEMSELEEALKNLNKGRARDPEGLCAELFQNNILGQSLKDSLLLVLNKIKEEGSILYECDICNYNS